MSVPFIQTAFSAGEISPSLFGHVDLTKVAVAAATARNVFVSYRGGLYSRAGTAFVGFSKQTGRSVPPRLITFQFSINQGLSLEFGNFYMRVISNGAFVTEETLAITNITNANPAVVTISAIGGLAATPINTFVVSSYAPGDQITLAGGSFASPAVLGVFSTTLLNLVPGAAGTGYAPADTIHLAGGTQTTVPIITIATTKVVGATVNVAGSGGTDGTQIVTGTTGTGTKFQASVTVSGGAITAVLGITLGGSYTVNPTAISAEPVTGASLSGAQLAVVMGVNTITLTNPGVFTANAATFTQASSSGGGSGATFQFPLYGISAVTVVFPGSYSAFPANPVAQSASSGTGLGATFTMTHAATTPFNNGDWVFLSGIQGMTQLNGRTLIVANVSGDSFQLTDVYGNFIDTTSYGAYLSGGTAARIYTLATPYAEEDLPYLKFTESADVMSLCCWNQLTGTSYPLFDLERFADNNWVLNPVTLAEKIVAPTSLSVTATNAPGTTTANYAFVVTALDASGNESIASPVGGAVSVDISSEQGALNLQWAPVSGANTYNVYKAPTAVNSAVPPGSLFGYAGTAYGITFNDSNIVPDLTQVPPLHENPFAPGQIIGLQITSGGAAISGLSWVVNTSTGSGFIGAPVLSADGTTLEAFIIDNTGENYAPGDTITFSVASGVAPTALLLLGPQTGTFPSVPAYYQERRVYAGSPNNPDTYWMSKPGEFTNFDSRIPTIPNDSITGSPWSVQVNGIQFLVSMPGGLVVLTGLSAWQLTGVGGSSLNPQPITPANQQAQPQAYNGCHFHIPPIKIDYDILYVQAKGSIVRDLSYNFFVNIYTGADLTQISSQLFTGFALEEWAWCEEPYKVLWTVRSDGVLLSLTYLKPQEVAGWARSDTNGLFQSVCSVTEAPVNTPTGAQIVPGVDALYIATQRFPGTNTAYMIERMDDRIWNSVEDCWCVDAGLQLGLPAPNATLNASSATGLGALAGVTNLIGGQNYSAGTTAFVVDDEGKGPGTGAVPVLAILSGVITSITFSPQGSGYVRPALVIIDPANTGSGASASPILDNSATFSAAVPIFNAGMIGNVIRMGGGVASVTQFVDSQHVIANITSPIVQTIPNSGGRVALQVAGTWSLSVPTTTISGLTHLAGMTVTGLMDGNVIPLTLVPASGIITLPAPATKVTVGLGFQVQFQSVYLNAPNQQAQRKKIAGVTARLENSRGVKMGSNQIDGSTLSPAQIAPVWNNLDDVPDLIPGGVQPPYGRNVIPLYTGDRHIAVTGGFQKPGQVALQQDNPLPLQILALVVDFLPGDTPETQAKERNGKDRAA